MGKLTAVLSGIAILLIFSYYLLSVSFNPLINWIGPIIGFRLNLILGLLWLDQGTPLQYVSIFAIWAIVGLIVGLSSKKFGGVFGTAITIWVVVGLIMTISIGAIAIGFLNGSNLNNLFNSLPNLSNVPPGSDIYSILHEPVISRWFDLLLPLISGGTLTTLLSTWSKLSTVSKVSEIFGIVFPFILGPLEAFIILVVFGVIGLYIKRLFFGSSKGPKRGWKLKKSKVASILFVLILIGSSSAIVLDHGTNVGFSTTTTMEKTAMAELGSVSMILPSVAPNGIGSSTATALQSVNNLISGTGNIQAYSNSPYGYPPSSVVSGLSNGSIRGDLAISLLEKQGSLLNVYAALNFSNKTNGFLTHPAFENSEFSFLILQSNLTQLVQSFENSTNSSSGSRSNSSSYNLSGTSLSGLTGYVNLVPGYIFVIAYNGSIAATKDYADSAASYVTSSLGMPSYQSLIAINSASINNLTKLGSSSGGSNSSNGISVYVYAATPNFKDVAQNFSKNLLGQIDSGPVGTLLGNSIDSGYLVPGSNSLSSSSSLIVLGDLNSGLFSGLLNNTAASAYSAFTSGGSFVLELSEWQHRFYSSDSNSVTGGTLFNYNGPLNFSSNEMTVLGFGSELSMSFTNMTSVLSGLSANLFTNNATLAKGLSAYTNNSSKIKTIMIANGPFYLSQHGYNVSSPFPANLSFSLSDRYIAYGEVALNISVTNNDNQPLNNLNISLQKFFSDYGSTIGNPNGNPTTIYIGTIAPGQTASFVYNITLKGTGLYYLPPPTASYNYGGTSFSTQYGSGYFISTQKPSVAYAVTSSVLVLMNLYGPLRPLTQFHLGPLNIVELIILLIIVLDVFLEYRSFVKWRTEKKRIKEGPSDGNKDAIAGEPPK
jgi:hypothetical protein